MEDVNNEERKDPVVSLKELNDILEQSRTIWSDRIEELSGRLKEELKKSEELQAEVISFIQIITSEITKNSYNIIISNAKLKNRHKSRFEFYNSSYPIKTNGTEKLKLIESEMAYYAKK